MKYLMPVLCAAALLSGCAKTDVPKVVVEDPDVVDAPKVVVETPKVVVEAPKVVVDGDQLEYLDGLMYFEEKLFTGVAVKKYPNGQKEAELNYKAGKMHGLHTGWYENGQKQWEGTSKDGKEDGLSTVWYENGQKKYEGAYEAGKLISEKSWDEDGKLK